VCQSQFNNNSGWIYGLLLATSLLFFAMGEAKTAVATAKTERALEREKNIFSKRILKE